MTMKDGGPAFPRYGNDEQRSASALCQDGMSLRDYFAAHALSGLCAAEQPILIGESRMTLARAAYFLADTMLKEREKQP